jgi:MarR family transcriptional regulator for hemolysin
VGENLLTKFNYFDTMARAQKGYARLLEPLCKKCDLTRNELDVLLFLANNPDFDRAVDIVNNRGLAKSHVSMSVTSLENRGLVERIPDPLDRRTVHLKLTEQAKEITDWGCRVQKQFMDYLHQGVTEEQLAMMHMFADRVHENIKNIEDVI